MSCRLCLSSNEDYFNFFDDQGIKLDIANIVKKHFWFEPKPEDNTSHSICAECWTVTKNFHELYILVGKLEEDWNSKLDTIKKDPCTSYNEELKFIDNFEIKTSEEEKCITQLNELLENQSLNLQANEDNASDLNDVKVNKDDNIFKRRGRPRKINRIEKKIHVVNPEPIKRRQRIHKLIKSEELKNANDISASKQECIQTIENDESQNTVKYEVENDINNSKDEIKMKKKVLRKRTAEETAAYEKKIAEGDATIAKYMKICCNICNVEQNNFTALRHHCTSVHGQPAILICCEKKFYRKIKLVEHIEKHINPEKNKCHICNHISATRWNLKLHIQRIHKEDKTKPFKCLDCDKQFKLKPHLLRHELIHLPDDQKKFKCSYCDKNFPSEGGLRYHVRLCHEGYYSGICDICGKAYNNRQDLKKHRLQVHEGGERSKIQCKYCDMKFASNYAYKVHKNKEHLNQNQNTDYKCKICNKVSPNSEALKNHVKYVHTITPKFPCSICKKIFKREIGLKEHMASHLGQSLYICPHCPQTFTHSSNMHHHRKLRHPKEFETDRKIKDNKKETWLQYASLKI